MGQRDANTFENNLREVMQFVLNHRIFDPDGELDEKHLAANEALGVMPGQAYDPDRVANLDGQPAQEAVCSVVSTNDGEPLNAQYDFGIDVVLRLYLPDLEGFETWTPPMAEKI